MTTTLAPTAPAGPVRVEKGHASEEELAAVTALLLARAAARTAPAPSRHRRTTAGWRRPERAPGYRSPHSWQG